MLTLAALLSALHEWMQALKRLRSVNSYVPRDRMRAEIPHHRADHVAGSGGLGSGMRGGMNAGRRVGAAPVKILLPAAEPPVGHAAAKMPPMANPPPPLHRSVRPRMPSVVLGPKWAPTDACRKGHL